MYNIRHLSRIVKSLISGISPLDISRILIYVSKAILRFPNLAPTYPNDIGILNVTIINTKSIKEGKTTFTNYALGFLTVVNSISTPG